VNILIEQSGAEHLDSGARAALGGGTALYLACLTAAQATTARRLPRALVTARLAAGGAIKLLLPRGAVIPPVGFAGAMAGDPGRARGDGEYRPEDGMTDP
jgi:hypothetical protein